VKVNMLDPSLFRRAILAGCANLVRFREEINRLNVFPVPDGDTGTNMSLTIQSAARQMESLRQSDSVGELAEALALGALMGARGNSGVILSQLLRGIGQGLAGRKTASKTDLARALQVGVDVAVKAVMRPVEGTILTVAKSLAQGYRLANTGDLRAALEEALRQAHSTLAKTPEMLPVLAQAGVVDAGGKGLIVFMEGILAGFKGEEIPMDSPPPPMVQGKPSVAGQSLVQPLEYRYCTEMIIKGHDLDLDDLRQRLEPMGDSLLVVGTNRVAKIHIHTNNPGAVFSVSCERGTLHDIKVDNMEDQHRDAEKGNLESASSAVQMAVEEMAYGVVAVAAGEGLARVLFSLGVHEVVSGGQTMNPSTEDLVAAIRRINAPVVYLLPNNKNIILAAEQAKGLVSEKQVAVIPTRSIPQGIAALLSFEPDISVENNIARMQASARSVQTGEITFAIRDSQLEEMSIKAGEILGLQDGKVVEKGAGVEEVVLRLLDRMVGNGGEIATLYYGAGVTQSEAVNLLERISNMYPHLELELHSGGQPIYYYIISVE